MAKKRKAPKTFEQPKSAKSAKYDVEETFDDSQDEFYAGRDKILLEEDANSKRRRRLAEQEKDIQPSDEEILAYQDEDDVEDEGPSDAGYPEDDVDDDVPQDGAQSRKLRDGEDGEDDELSEEEEENWGADRADYYNADIIETEADAIEEENEAKRLHQKQVAAMTEADFGFDENEWTGEKESATKSKSYREKLPEAQVPADATDQQRLEILRSRYPEMQLLIEEFLRLHARLTGLNKEAERTLKQIKEGKELADGLPIMAKRDALVAYLASISLYFALVSSRYDKQGDRTINAMPPVELHDHAIIQTLYRARALWDKVADTNAAALKDPTPLRPSKALLPPNSKVNGHKATLIDTQSTTKSSKKSTQARPPQKSRTLDEDIADDEDQLSIDLTNIQLPSSTKQKSIKKSKSKTKDKANKPIDITTLLNDAAATADPEDSPSDYGDEQPLTEEQYAEKDRKRKSLRFHTSQIAAKANKRGHASREAGGDDDLPYKERNRDRQERLMKAAEARGRDAADDFDGDGDEADDGYGDGNVLSNGRRGSGENEDEEYYDKLLNAGVRKKADKKARAEAYAAAAREGAEVYEEETVGADGKRAITYAIAKNKGLAPRRKKEVRNPRVKKRMKFDEKMKKLGSMRQVYKGGEGRGGYGGELTGIKTGVVKSVKL